MKYFSTGEVAKKLNITKRTIRYYDSIGLVVPDVKDQNGKRCYTEEDVLLLQKVLLLKSTSMSLVNIKKMINQISIEQIVEIHKEQLLTNIEDLKKALAYTHSLINTIKLEGSIPWERLLPLVSKDLDSSNENKNKVMNKLFVEEEKEILENNLPKMESDSSSIKKWINLIRRIELSMHAGNSPSSVEAQIIAEDTLLLSKDMFNGNSDLERKFWEARKSKEDSQAMKLYPVDESILEYLDEAIEQYNKVRA